MAQLIVSGNASAAQVLTGTTFSAGVLYGASGTMTDNGAVAITPSASSQSIVAGYHNGSGSVAAVVVPAANVLTGTTIAGTAGTMPNRGAVAITPNTGTQTIAAGYHNGSGTVAGDANLVAANILSAISIFGVAGSAQKRLFASGSVTDNGAGTSSFTKYDGTTEAHFSLTVSGLAFTPQFIFASRNGGFTQFTIYISKTAMQAVRGTDGDIMLIDFFTPGGLPIVIKSNTAPASITGTGFTIPTAAASGTNTYTWYSFG